LINQGASLNTVIHAVKIPRDLLQARAWLIPMCLAMDVSLIRRFREITACW
jgi:hypothetical protein